MGDKMENKMNKDYVGYSFWKNLYGFKLGIDINPIVEDVIKKYEENKIPYLRCEIEYEVWKKMRKYRYEVMENVIG